VIRAFVMDDEPLAVKRLTRMLKETGRVEVTGAASDPVEGLAALRGRPIDVLFLDIQMPGMTGFQVLEKLDPQPFVVFTTAYDQYALRAFEVNSIDYLLKPIEAPQLARALDKIERRQSPPPEWRAVLAALKHSDYPERIASRVGERVHILELAKVTHFFARDKLTYAAVEGKNYVVDHTVADLEEKLDPRQFCRIHRATLLNLSWVREVDAWFGGRVLVRLKDAKGTELPASRERVAELKKRLGI
jgi:two-component system LytT family response regulator